jgi:hypothetical protein
MNFDKDPSEFSTPRTDFLKIDGELKIYDFHPILY